MGNINKVSNFQDSVGNFNPALIDELRRIVTVTELTVTEMHAGTSGPVNKSQFYDIVSYTVPTGKSFFMTGFNATGDGDGVYRLYQNSNILIEKRTNAAEKNISGDFDNPVKFDDGDVVAIKIQHYIGATREFQGTLIGYTR